MSRRLRIIHVYKDVYPPVQGGIERTIERLACLTARDERFQVEIIVAAPSFAGGERNLADGVRVREVASCGRLLSTPLAPGFLTALRRANADLFHFHVPHPTGELAFLLSGLDTPAVATYHSDIVRQRLTLRAWRPLLQRFLRRMQVIMPTSQRYLETSVELQPHRTRCRVVPLGLPTDAYSLSLVTAKRAVDLRDRHGDFILFLGCLRRYKGLPFLLEALAGLPRRRLLIAGAGPMRSHLEALARNLGIADRVHFLGAVSHEDAVALLHAAAVLVLPSHQRSEAFGLCQIEAMLCELPVISTDLPTGVPEVNRNGVTGLVVPPGDVKALRHALNRLLGDAELRKRMGSAGRDRALSEYSDTLMAHRVMEVYAQVLGNKRASYS